jgi:hypothetical protein
MLYSLLNLFTIACYFWGVYSFYKYVKSSQRLKFWRAADKTLAKYPYRATSLVIEEMAKHYNYEPPKRSLKTRYYLFKFYLTTRWWALRNRSTIKKNKQLLASQVSNDIYH